MYQNNQLKSSFDVYHHSLAVEYYSNILYNSPYSEFPIHQLIGHRGQASSEVQGVAANAMDLKRFLTRYPSIFTVTENDCVRLVKTIADYRIPREKINLKVESPNDSDIAVQYYVNVMKQKLSTASNTDLPLKKLIGHRSQAPPVVQNCAKNVNELNSFLSNHPETFTVLPGNFVTLKKSPSVTNNKNKERNYASKPKYDDSSLAVEYYSNILNTTGPNYSISRLIGHRGQAPPEVKDFAFTDSDLKLFLSRFPNIFSITGNAVTLKTVVPALDSNEGISNVEYGNYSKKYNPDVAVQFYSNILKERGCYGQQFPIQKLTGYRNKAPLEVRSCAKNPKELSILFSNYPKIFTLTSNKCVILIEPPLNNIVSKVQNLSLASDDNKCNSEAIDYFINILRRGIPNSEIPIAKLMIYLNQAPVNVRREARNEEELIQFFLKHPHMFTVVHNKFVKLIDSSTNSNNIVQSTKSKPIECIRNLNVDKSARTLRYFPSLEFPQNPGFSGTWEDHVLDNTVLVTEENECLDACEVIKKEKVIALDCEGYNLGRGILSLIQIALINGTVYIFDIYELPHMISCGLKEIIESDKILKVINYCRNDCLNLKLQYNVDMRYIFDVSVAYHVIESKLMSLSNFKPAGFNQICANYGVPTNSCKDDLKFIYITQPKYWLNRPLNIKMVSYAAFDVASLVPYLYCEFLKRMDQETEIVVWRLSQRMCIT